MAQLEPLKDELQQRHVSLLCIAAEKRAGMFKPEKFLQEHPVSFPFLLDEDRAVTKAYGVYQRLKMDAINIARPATFLIGSDGTVRWIYIGDGQTDRAPLDLLREQIAALGRQ
jgi:peroxiredoxin